ncbi:MAG TPA: hypothetical protein VF276_14515 [Chloroflexia bacterium]
MANWFRVSVPVLGLLLVLTACGEAAAPGANTQPTATVIPVATVAPTSTAQATPAAGVPVDADVARTVNLLNQMRGHLMVAQDLAAAGQADAAAEQAEKASSGLMDAVANTLTAKGADTALRGALDAYTAAVKQGGAAAAPAQQAALAAVDGAILAVAGPDAATNTALQGQVLTGLLEKIEEEYAESIKDGKIAELEPYQSGYGILQVARLHFDALEKGMPSAPVSEMTAARTALGKLSEAMPGPQPPATVVSPEAVEQQIDAAKAAIAAATGTTAGTLDSAAAIAAIQADVQAALELYKAGNKDAAYEKAAGAYLDGFEKLEPDLLKADKDIVPAQETDFKALRDGIKAGQSQSELEAIAARIDSGLQRAGQLLAK